MTDAELDAIEKRVAAIKRAHQIEVGQCVAESARDVPALVAEVRRLRAAYELQQFPQKVSPYVRETGAEIDPL